MPRLVIVAVFLTVIGSGCSTAPRPSRNPRGSWEELLELEVGWRAALGDLVRALEPGEQKPEKAVDSLIHLQSYAQKADPKGRVLPIFLTLEAVRRLHSAGSIQVPDLSEGGQKEVLDDDVVVSLGVALWEFARIYDLEIAALDDGVLLRCRKNASHAAPASSPPQWLWKGATPSSR